MAKLMKCKACGHEVSKQAKSCPNCGQPIKRDISTGKGCLIIIGVVLLIIVGIIMSQQSSSPPDNSQPRPVVQVPQPTPALTDRPEPTATPESTAAPEPTATPDPDEARRKEIYLTDIESETRAIHEADQKFPDFGEKHLAYVEEQAGIYRKELLKKYKITDEELSKINIEGITKGWDKPATPTPLPKRANDAKPLTDKEAMKIIASYKDPQSNKTMKQVYKEISAIASTNFGWHSISCPASICKNRQGFIVSFRLVTNIGAKTPMWFVPNDLSQMYWINGSAKGYSPELPQIDIDISAAKQLIEQQGQGSLDVQ